MGAAPRQRGNKEAWRLRHPSLGAREDGGGKDQAIGDDDGDIGAMRPEFFLRLRILQARRGQYRYRMMFGDPMDRGLRRLQAASARRLWRAGVDGGDFVALPDDFEERRRRKIGRAHEDDTHDASAIASGRRSVKTSRVGDRYGVLPQNSAQLPGLQFSCRRKRNDRFQQSRRSGK